VLPSENKRVGPKKTLALFQDSRQIPFGSGWSASESEFYWEQRGQTTTSSS